MPCVRTNNREMKPDDFITTMQRRTGVTAVGPSALRGQGKGVLKAAQSYLGAINLRGIPAATSKEYERWLDHHTEKLLDRLPVKNRPWGAARKALNLCMRDVLYNRYLSDHFGLSAIEPWMEVPLDSAVAKGLKEHAGRGKLPQWPGLKNLEADISKEFQTYAKEYAKQRGMARVHLDVYLWLEFR